MASGRLLFRGTPSRRGKNDAAARLAFEFAAVDHFVDNFCESAAAEVAQIQLASDFALGHCALGFGEASDKAVWGNLIPFGEVSHPRYCARRGARGQVRAVEKGEIN